MYINNISGINYETVFGQKHVSNGTKENIQTLLKMMNQGTKYVENKENTVFNSDILASLSLGKKIRFSDNRLYICTINKNKKDYTSDCSIRIGKNRLDINSESGKIIAYKKGWLTSWLSLLQKVDEAITTFLANFDNNSVVTKHRFKILGFTKKGIEQLHKKK